MQERSAELPHVGMARAPSWSTLARQYAVLSAEYGALQAEHLALQHEIQTRPWRLLDGCRKALRTLRLQIGRFLWSRLRLLSREPLASAASLLEHAARASAAPARAACSAEGVHTTADPRVVYIGDRGPYETASMRYRAHNLIEALALHGTPATFVPEEDLAARLAEVMSHDIIVLVRRRWNPRIKSLIEAAQAADIPLVFDLDDFLFDPWVLPYIDSARGRLSQWTVQYIKDLRATQESCDYFTAPARFLIEQAAIWRRPGWLIRNGLNATQLARCQALLEAPQRVPAEGPVRIGYFSGTKTHQADFRAAYPALVRLLQECKQVRLVIVGELDLQEFPGLEPFAPQVEQHPCVAWPELPALIAKVDINLAPLEVNPYTQGKSELKYFEAGILKVPTIASPTDVFARALRHGEAGLLAASDEEWYRGLKLLVSDAALRCRLGENAHAHALREYVPAAVAAEALAAYRQILRVHRDRREAAA